MRGQASDFNIDLKERQTGIEEREEKNIERENKRKKKVLKQPA